VTLGDGEEHLAASPVERLRRYFTVQATGLAEQNYERGCLVGNFSAELADHRRLIRDRLSSNFVAWSRPIEECIRDGQKAGEISRDTEPRVLAEFLLNSFEGAMLRMKAEKHGSPLDDVMTVVFSRVLT
jgi:TetR/AcrR family transcriptional repressor of nem operon